MSTERGIDHSGRWSRAYLLAWSCLEVAGAFLIAVVAWVIFGFSCSSENPDWVNFCSAASGSGFYSSLGVLFWTWMVAVIPVGCIAALLAVFFRWRVVVVAAAVFTVGFVVVGVIAWTVLPSRF